MTGEYMTGIIRENQGDITMKAGRAIFVVEHIRKRTPPPYNLYGSFQETANIFQGSSLTSFVDPSPFHTDNM
jgi:hypothetical protein